MMSYLKDNFLLKNKTAERLYFNFAKDMPIFDYHCHLPEKQILTNETFDNIYDIWLAGDHYKWRLMRNFGVDEEFITGGADEYEKFKAFAKTMPYLIGNPLYHWTHLELKKYFGIEEHLSEATCESIWNRVNECLAKPEYSAQNLIKMSNVEVVCTTDDPIDTLEYHEQLKDFSTKVLPTFRPDKAVEEMLNADKIEGLSAVITSKNTYVAPFVNAEEC